MRHTIVCTPVWGLTLESYIYYSYFIYIYPQILYLLKWAGRNHQKGQLRRKPATGGQGVYSRMGYKRFWGMRPPRNHQFQHVTPQANARCRKGDPKTSVLGTTYLCVFVSICYVYCCVCVLLCVCVPIWYLYVSVSLSLSPPLPSSNPSLPLSVSLFPPTTLFFPKTLVCGSPFLHRALAWGVTCWNRWFPGGLIPQNRECYYTPQNLERERWIRRDTI